MKIESLKELDKLMQLCQKRGIDSITIDGIALTFHISSKPVKHNATSLPDYSSDFPEANIPVPKFTGEIADVEIPETTELSKEQLLMWSVDSQGQQ